LSQNASSCRVEHLKKIYNALRLRGVDCLEQDGYGRTALHYAVESRNRDLVLMLLEEGADPAILDMYGYSPLIMYLKGKNIKNIIIYNQRNGDFDIILKSLIERGANVN
jgi:ankyrin repeat protein